MIKFLLEPESLNKLEIYFTFPHKIDIQIGNFF